jgi:predicted O-linked N-acetylglucosamine transferase (SPINDLY family)
MNRRERRAQGKQSGSDPRLDQAFAAFQSGRLAEAEAILKTLLRTRPRDAAALHLLGLLAFQQGLPALALERLSAAVRAKPDYAEALNNLGRVLLALDRPADAAERFRAALRHAPGIAEIHSHLAEALLAETKVGEAAHSFRQAGALDPAQPAIWAGLGRIAVALGDIAAGRRRHAVALALSPGFGPSLRSLAEARLVGGDAKGAIAGFEAALRAAPNDVGLLGNLAVAWREAGRLDRGLSFQRRILALAPAQGPTLGHLAQGLLTFGRPEAALLAARRRLAAEPSESARKGVRAGLLYVPGIDPERAAALRRRLAPASVAAPRWRNTRDPERALRIGYVSSDLRDHPVARSILPVIESHDRGRVQPFLYGEVAREDAVTQRFRNLASYRSTVGLDDAALSRTMREDAIDIAVFVAGSFDANRLEASAPRCAPLQISLHDGGSSGIEAVDALIADPWLVPTPERARFSERVLRLPDLYLHQPIENAPEPRLPDGPPVFVAAANPAKINRETLALWSKVLAAVPEARLRLKYRNAFRDRSLRAAFEALLPTGVVRFEEGSDDATAHLGFYRQAHVALDTGPFSGSTSSFEALWMGVPVVTLAGGSMAGRWTGALLKGIGREEWIAADAGDYVARAAALIRDRERLTRERQSLRAALSPLADAARRTRQFERLYRGLWRQWCARR